MNEFKKIEDVKKEALRRFDEWMSQLTLDYEYKNMLREELLKKFNYLDEIKGVMKQSKRRIWYYMIFLKSQ